MRTFTIGELKTNFSEILEWVRSGEEVAIAFGRKKEIVAFLVPKSFLSTQKRPLGLLEGNARVVFAEDFKMTESEFLGLLNAYLIPIRLFGLLQNQISYQKKFGVLLKHLKTKYSLAA
jgi:antitoxin (DNA-binding transcriptional repressor) of toxin-antitoxin stability system